MAENRHDELGHIRSLLNAKRGFDHFPTIAAEIREVYGLANVVYHAAFVPGYTGNEHLLYLTYDSGWVSEYLENDYFRIDPVEAAVRLSGVPVDWSAVDRVSSPTVRNFFARADRAGVGRQGISIPVRHPTGGYGLFTITSNGSEREWEAEKRQKLPELMLIASHFHDRVIKNALKQQAPLSSMPLSEREAHTLALLASGYEVKQIADKLKRSQTTIRNELRLASVKLGCTNYYQAATKAIVHGVIGVEKLQLHYEPGSESSR